MIVIVDDDVMKLEYVGLPKLDFVVSKEDETMKEEGVEVSSL